MPASVETAAAPDLRKRLLVLALTLVVETIVIGVIFGGLFYMGSRRAAEKLVLQQTIAQEELKTQAKLGDAKKVAVYAAQTVAAKAALDGHARWTNFYAFLEERTKPNVKYASFTGDAETGMVSLDAIATSYRDAAEQIVIFREDPMVIDVRTTSASADLDEKGNFSGVTFSLNIKIKKELWRGVYASAGQTTVSQAAVVSLACGASADQSDAGALCFAGKVSSCAPATVTAKNTLGNGEYLVLGSGKDGCRVSFTYATDLALKEFAGKSYECVYDASKEFWGQTGRTLDGCTGTLVDALKPTTAPVVTH